MKRMNRKGFTLVEIMIVVAIIALLAAIAIPNLLRARLSSNDALAQSTLRAMSTAAESYATANNGQYPTNIASLTGATPPYLNVNYIVDCPDANNPCSGYWYDDNPAMTASSYSFVATPANLNVSGSAIYTITTGGVLTP